MRVTPKESEVQKAVMDLLSALKIFAIRLNTGGFRVGRQVIRTHSGGAGVADILAFPVRRIAVQSVDFVRPEIRHIPQIWWIECKTATGKQSAEQKCFQQKVESEGHRYLVARSVEDVLRELDGDN